MQIQIISTLFAVWNKKTSKLPFQLRLRFRVFYSGSWSGETIYRIFLPFKTNSRVYFPVDPAQENAQRFQTFLANDREKYTSGIPGVYRTPLYYILLNPSESSLSRFMLSLSCALPLCTDYDVTPQGKKKEKQHQQNSNFSYSSALRNTLHEGILTNWSIISATSSTYIWIIFTDCYTFFSEISVLKIWRYI